LLQGSGAESRHLRALDGGKDRLLSVRQVAERLGVCTATVYTLCERNELAHVRVLNAIRIAPADLARFVAVARRGK
jgi:excisionase family DNA binding protein